MSNKTCMNVINKETDASSGLIYDQCYSDVQKKQSAGPGLYQLNDLRSCDCEISNVKDVALNRPGFAGKQFRDGYGWTSKNGSNVEKDSKLR